MGWRRAAGRIVLAAACLSALTDCASLRDEASLYRELGERPGVEALVETLLGRIIDDDRVVAHFAGSDIERLRRMLVEQICNISGGPCEYTGDSMIDVHTGMQLTHADFNAVVEDLIAAMEDRGLGFRTQNRLIARLAPLRPQIVKR